MPNPSLSDSEFVFEAVHPFWEELRGARILITGGSGFFGCSLLEPFLNANERLGLDATVTVLARDFKAFNETSHHVACHPSVHFWPADIRNFGFKSTKFTHIIHAATYSDGPIGPDRVQEAFDTIVNGTSRVLELAKRCGAYKLLFTSSGAVYGPQPSNIERLTEEYNGGGPSFLSASGAYAEGKRVAECLVANASGIEAKIARCFAFIGPYLPLDRHFAAGNFVRDALNGGPIRILGDGTDRRSYLYSADMAAWLWTILLQGRPGRPYNVGSECSISIETLARKIAAIVDPGIKIDRRQAALISQISGQTLRRYIPSTSRARSELNLTESYSLDEAIRRTVRHHRLRAKAGATQEFNSWQTSGLETRSQEATSLVM